MSATPAPLTAANRPRKDTTPGTRFNPMWIRLETGELNWKRILLALAVTAISGYIATQSQRGTSGPDVNTIARLRLARAGEQFGEGIIKSGMELAAVGASIKLRSARAYANARPL